MENRMDFYQQQDLKVNKAKMIRTMLIITAALLLLLGNTEAGQCGGRFCTTEYNPQCGSDGVTYSNPCQMEHAQCNQPSLQLAHKGECMPEVVKREASKPGDCPPIDEDNVLCVDQINPCATDMDCEGVEKCCQTGCSPICTKPAEKQGYCPTVGLDQVGACVTDCNTDWDCAGSEKCCHNGCGNTCQRARTSKPGDCPPIDEDNILCFKQISGCKTDMDCGGVEKCCWTGCSPICTNPAPREGFCPAVASDAMGICITECEEDHDCTFPKKCCNNGCGKTCQTPEIPKAGICPAVEEGMMGICMEGCSTDSECEGDQKCCSNGCGHACKPPANNTCVVNGKHYLPGPVPDPDGCNSCKCMAGGGGIACTRMMCSCEISGETHSMGESYPAGDGCNTCKCRGDRDHLRRPCTDYLCDGDTEPRKVGYMKTAAIVGACVGGIGLIITVIVVIGVYIVYKKNNKKSKENSVDKSQLVPEAQPLPPKA